MRRILRSIITHAAGAAASAFSYALRNESWLLVIAVAVVSDILDYFGGAIPVIGDVIDIGTSAILYPKLGNVNTAFTLIELIPGADFLPTYTVITLYSLYQEYQEEIRKMRDVPVTGTENEGAEEE